ncbi:MAG: hypothetical protein Q9180_008191 [Flavoplaca navasiana]
MPGRTYIQPQWVWDCVNGGKLLRPDLYAPGATMPPHLSPWVKPSKNTSDPTVPLAEQENSEDEREVGEANSSMEKNDNEALTESNDDTGDKDDHGMNVADLDAASEDEDFDGFDSDDSKDRDAVEATDEGTEHQRQLEAEAAGLPYTASSTKATEAGKKAARKKKDDEEELERRKMMMPKKKRKLYEKMAYSNKATDDEAKRLRGKRRRLEKM